MGVYVQPPLSAEDFEIVPFISLRVLWGQQSACVTRASFSTYHRNPEEWDSQPKITHGNRAAAIIPVHYKLTRLLLLPFLKEGIKCMLKANNFVSTHWTRRRD